MSGEKYHQDPWEDDGRLPRFVAGWLKQRRLDSRSWQKLYGSLRGIKLFLFRSKNTHNPQEMVGTLLIGAKTVLRAGCDSREFELCTFSYEDQELDHMFRCRHARECNDWKSAILSVIRLDVPSPSEIHVSSNTFYHLVDCVIKLSSILEVEHFRHRGHKFYNDPSKTDIPTWFFENCTRQLSEQIMHYGHKYGNVLMRESSSHHTSGSYTISVRIEEQQAHFLHYEVIPQGDRFVIRMDVPHDPFPCLSVVMQYFSSVTGTRPFVTNDLVILGVKRPEYSLDVNSGVRGGTTRGDRMERKASTESVTRYPSGESWSSSSNSSWNSSPSKNHNSHHAPREKEIAKHSQVSRAPKIVRSVVPDASDVPVDAEQARAAIEEQFKFLLMDERPHMSLNESPPPIPSRSLRPTQHDSGTLKSTVRTNSTLQTTSSHVSSKSNHFASVPPPPPLAPPPPSSSVPPAPPPPPAPSSQIDNDEPSGLLAEIKAGASGLKSVPFDATAHKSNATAKPKPALPDFASELSNKLKRNFIYSTPDAFLEEDHTPRPSDNDATIHTTSATTRTNGFERSPVSYALPY